MTKCPSCGSNRIHRSRTRGFVERMRRQFTQKRAFRCEACGWRGWGIETDRPHRQGDLPIHDVDPVDLDAIDRSLDQEDGSR